MANQVWPPDLPQSPRLADLQETPPQLSVRTDMDAGPAKIRRRFTAGVTVWQMSLMLTRNQRGMLLDFYLVTCQGGSLPFDWINPVTIAPATFRWVERPSIRPLAMRINAAEPYLATFVLEEQPSVSNAVIVPPGSPELPPWYLLRDDRPWDPPDLTQYGYETAGGLITASTRFDGSGGTGPLMEPMVFKDDLPNSRGNFGTGQDPFGSSGNGSPFDP